MKEPYKNAEIGKENLLYQNAYGQPQPAEGCETPMDDSQKINYTTETKKIAATTRIARERVSRANDPLGIVRDIPLPAAIQHPMSYDEMRDTFNQIYSSGSQFASGYIKTNDSALALYVPEVIAYLFAVIDYMLPLVEGSQKVGEPPEASEEIVKDVQPETPEEED